MNEQMKRRRERFQSKSAFIAAKYLRRMDELSGRPDSLTPFMDMLKKVHIEFETIASDSKKTIGTYCMMVPQELIYAAEALQAFQLARI